MRGGTLPPRSAHALFVSTRREPRSVARALRAAMPDARAGIAPSAVQAGGAAASPSFETLDAARRAGVLLLVVEGREYYFQLPDAPDSASRTAKWPAPGAAMRQEHRRNRPPAYSRRLAARKVARNAEHASEPADASDGTQPPAPPQQQQPREDAHAGERVEKRPIDDDCEQPRVRRPHLPPLLPPGLPPPAALAPRKLNFDNDVAEPPPEPPLRARDYCTPRRRPRRSARTTPRPSPSRRPPSRGQTRPRSRAAAWARWTSRRHPPRPSRCARAPSTRRASGHTTPRRAPPARTRCTCRRSCAQWQSTSIARGRWGRGTVARPANNFTTPGGRGQSRHGMNTQP